MARERWLPDLLTIATVSSARSEPAGIRVGGGDPARYRVFECGRRYGFSTRIVRYRQTRVPVRLAHANDEGCRNRTMAEEGRFSNPFRRWRSVLRKVRSELAADRRICRQGRPHRARYPRGPGIQRPEARFGRRLRSDVEHQVGALVQPGDERREWSRPAG